MPRISGKARVVREEQNRGAQGQQTLYFARVIDRRHPNKNVPFFFCVRYGLAGLDHALKRTAARIFLQRSSQLVHSEWCSPLMFDGADIQDAVWVREKIAFFAQSS